jgi:thioredoxin-like negative regulator of GroEL
MKERQLRDLLAAGSRSRREGLLAAARTSYEQVLRVDPENSEAHYWLAVIADDQGRFADAERHYSLLLNKDPRDANVLASLGWSQLLQRRFDDSERTLRTALAYAPTHQTALYNLGWLYGTRGDYEQALAIFRSAGSEADAQRALAELRQNAERSDLIAATGSQAANGGNLPAIDSRAGSAADLPTGRSSAGRVAEQPPQIAATAGSQDISIARQTAVARGGIDSPRLSAPAPWNAGAFTEIDRYASSSPSQANRPREAEPQSLGTVAASGARPPGGMEPTNYEQTAQSPGNQAPGNQSPGNSLRPVIRPGTSNTATGNRAGNFDRNPVLPTGALAAVISSSSNGASTRSAGIPDKTGTAADGRPGSLSSPSATPQGTNLYEAQTMAAQLGLAAGVGGPGFVYAERVPRAAPEETTSLRPVTPEPALSGTNPQISPLPAATDRQTSALRPPLPLNSRASEAGGQRAAPLPPWPGRNSLPPPVPTDVLPSAETPVQGPAGSVPAIGAPASRPLPAAGR